MRLKLAACALAIALAGGLSTGVSAQPYGPPPPGYHHHHHHWGHHYWRHHHCRWRHHHHHRGCWRR